MSPTKNMTPKTVAVATKLAF